MVLRRAASACGLLAALAVVRVAHAADGGAPDAGDGGPSPSAVIATYCNEPELECTFAPLSYAKTIKLPIAFDFDTGWVPSNSDLQVRFFLKIPASTTVELDGQLETTWPEAMTLATPGGTHGLLAFDYGLEIGAKAKLDVNVIGIPVKWEGDIPYVPQVDFHLKGEKQFPPWAFAPNTATATGSSQKVRLFEVNLLDLVGIPSQIGKGGVALDVSGDLSATYQTERIRIEPALAGDLPISSQTGTTTRAFAGGTFVEYDVWPEGRVDYTGTVHLIPTFFVEVLGKDFNLPIVDIPVSFAIGTQDFLFDPVRVHVPLPDLEPVVAELDFGTVEVGEQVDRDIELENVGEAKARATGFVDATAKDAFVLVASEVLVEQQAKNVYGVRFAPKNAGTFETTLTLVTNDPDERFLPVKLRGIGIRGDTPDAGADAGSDGVAADGMGDEGGCGCGVASTPTGGATLLLGLGLLAARRRMRRQRRLKPRTGAVAQRSDHGHRRGGDRSRAA